MATKTCSCCGRKTDSPVTYQKKIYCPLCRGKLGEEEESLSAEKQKLYSQIRDLYGVREIPSEVISALDRELSSGKKIKGMMLTLDYYFKIKNNTNADIFFVAFVIREQYDNAKKYYADMKKLKQSNLAVDISPIKRTVVLTEQDLETKRAPKMIDISSL